MIANHFYLVMLMQLGISELNTLILGIDKGF